MKTRFCPSPTGNIHLGNARTALFCALLAKKMHGKFLLRIEDTDQERSDEKHTQQLFKDLHWLGLNWQEGPEVGGDAGPYWQSQRQSIYEQFYRHLEERNLAYPCFCTAQQLAIQRKIQLAQGHPPRYAGTCRALTKDQVAAKFAEGLEATLRFHIVPDSSIVFRDLVKGEQHFNTNDLGDFVIRRADGTAPFLFCNAIDDALMGVSHVLRGEDHLANTPRQIAILRALDLRIPEYGHISLILNPNGGPLSKREGSRSIMELRNAGFLPEGITNYLARLGHYYSDAVYMSLEQLATLFDINNLGKAPARFDQEQLLFWQHEAVIHTDDEALWNWFGPEVHTLVPDELKNFFIMLVKPNVTFPNDALHWAKIFFMDALHFDDEKLAILQQTGSDFFNIALQAIDSFGLDYQKLCDELKIKLNVRGKALFQPLRIALTSELHGPELKGIMELLGKQQVRERLLSAGNMSLCQA